MVLTALFWKWSGMASIGVFGLVLVAPFVTAALALSFRAPGGHYRGISSGGVCCVGRLQRPHVGDGFGPAGHFFFREIEDTPNRPIRPLDEQIAKSLGKSVGNSAPLPSRVRTCAQGVGFSKFSSAFHICR